MPYIEQEARRRLGVTREAHSAGELNYLLTGVALDYCDRQGYSYNTFNEVVGALECAKQEFYRKIVVPYEDVKCEQNGDVYP